MSAAPFTLIAHLLLDLGNKIFFEIDATFSINDLVNGYLCCVVREISRLCLCTGYFANRGNRQIMRDNVIKMSNI